MLIAITRRVSPDINQCELTYQQRVPIDFARAEEQHLAYEQCLRELGAEVIAHPAEPGFPDCMFVEDPTVVFDEVAVIMRMGVESRRGEEATLVRALRKFRAVMGIAPPATIEGGDVLRVGRNVFVGRSPRTNAEGVVALKALLEPIGYSVQPVELRGCMHLKSGCTTLDDGTILAHREWIDTTPFETFRIVDVAPDEARAANVLRVGETIVMAEGFPETRKIVERLGYRVRTLEISELMKAEAGLTCSSLLFEAEPTDRLPPS